MKSKQTERNIAQIKQARFGKNACEGCKLLLRVPLLHAAERLVSLRSEAEGYERDVGHSEESEAAMGRANQRVRRGLGKQFGVLELGQGSSGEN